ncbi:MAG: amidohydrolase family protein [Planctomycetes bacterium]|nr:amidohydrolase family protein [Planctomycetota bacterium]
MRTPSSLPFQGASLFVLSLCLGAAAAAAQDPTPPAPPVAPPTQAPAQPAAEPPAATAPTTPPAAEGEAPRRRGPRRPPLVLEAGTVHPVAGPAIQNGVVVIRGDRILAVGKQGEVELPQGATVRSFPTGHIYPGLIDAQTDAFTDASLRDAGDSDGGSGFVDDLRVQHDRSDELIQAGITTAYVSVRSPALVRGQGAIVRPLASGFEPWSGRERAALQLRMTQGPGPSHALQRQQQMKQVDGLFEGLEEFRKARIDHEDAVKKYDKEFADYLAFHQKKKDAEKKDDKPAGDKAPAGDAKPATPPAGADAGGPPREGRPGRGNRGGPPREQPPKEEPPKQPDHELEAALATLFDALAQDPPKPVEPPKPAEPPKQGERPAGPPQGGPPQGGAPAGGAAAGDKKDEAPKRPTYPKAPDRDPQREALLRVLDGELPLRVEAHRPDELRAALQLQRERKIPVLVLEQAYGAAPLVAQLAEQGASVVLTELLPVPFEPPYDHFDPTALPAALQQAGVPFAIATGSGKQAGLLPLLAAAAVGRGLDRDAALRAITLTPAEILGVAADTGSLQAGKYADVLVTDRPLFATDSRVLLVLQKGRAEFEVK